jgi:hypothetical protein
MNEWMAAIPQPQLEVLKQALSAFIFESETNLGVNGFPSQFQIEIAWSLARPIDEEVQRRIAEYKRRPAPTSTLNMSED